MDEGSDLDKERRERTSAGQYGTENRNADWPGLRAQVKDDTKVPPFLQ